MVTRRYQKVRLTDDGHEGVEVSNVETLPGNIDEELYHCGPLLLLCWLQKQRKCFRLFHFYLTFLSECYLSLHVQV